MYILENQIVYMGFSFIKRLVYAQKKGNIQEFWKFTLKKLY